MNHLMNLLQSAGVRRLLDSVTPGAAPSARLDAADPDMVSGESAAYAIQTISMRVASSLQTWCETGADDLGDGENKADRLLAMLIGIADEDKDGELTEDEQMVVEVAMNEAWSYLAAKGVAESDLDDLFNSDDPATAGAAADRVCEYLAEKLPNGEAADDEADDFAFGPEATEGVFDSAGRVMLDAVYKKRFAIRGGKKTMIRKRVSGTVRLSAKQKVAIRKAGRKAHGARAMAKRMKSMRIRNSMGLNRR